ncbi:MAG: serine--tRNA ligase [Candidatus Buchananbacteria bacterium RIFCSPHIGHO2_02_FULL_40_13]|uniref:Serine--tRNA ligase n=1 Tax=Candidatus Buchananbacteria bacterium RIFCSPLOWO2_01_FULL_39_33 TaxID=1797543 RepID=A0A1G1YIZ3_9BACT|nr:MAG: serine--tRNA ligase [Candidatus Buchananbacteria bacterium RIFCSPHIGHO2_02_FULL_40_13]OGY51796.1 MAG: serine--tRNA ligase [Candidatus Buchananbacteria bacterium RIFCSPLOWO2_01_FULL_39_33]
MLDINKIRDDQEGIRKALLKRLEADQLDQILKKVLKLDKNRRKLISQTEKLKAERNQQSKTKPTSEIIERLKTSGEDIRILDGKLAKIEIKFFEIMSELPNIPADDVVSGGKENNQVVKTFGEKPKFNFTPKDHYGLATSLDIIDYERGVKMSGANFWIYKGQGALLEWALLNYFIDFHTKNGYQFMIPPFLLTEKSAYTSGHLPKFKDDLFWTQDKTCLNATSEMMLGNYHRDEILDEKLLPLKYCAYSACFRREAGSYGQEERGMIRGHQFNKIEMFQFTKPDDSALTFNELVESAEKLVEGLSLHYRTRLLAAGDASAAMAKTKDIEVWIPSMNTYKEVSSASNALDYQARRGNIRFKNTKTDKNEFVHTLNASGLATSRLFPAILEQFQQADGSILIPQVLQKYTGFDKITSLK